jgi:hypothetical protein
VLALASFLFSLTNFRLFRRGMGEYLSSYFVHAANYYSEPNSHEITYQMIPDEEDANG